MDIEVSSSAKKCKKPEHVSPEIFSKPVSVCGHCSKSVHQKALLAKQYSVISVGSGFILLVRA